MWFVSNQLWIRKNQPVGLMRWIWIILWRKTINGFGNFPQIMEISSLLVQFTIFWLIQNSMLILKISMIARSWDLLTVSGMGHTVWPYGSIDYGSGLIRFTELTIPVQVWIEFEGKSKIWVPKSITIRKLIMEPEYFPVTEYLNSISFPIIKFYFVGVLSLTDSLGIHELNRPT